MDIGMLVEGGMIGGVLDVGVDCEVAETELLCIVDFPN